MILQGFGLAVVMVGLVGRGKLFKRPNPLALMREWFQSGPKWRGDRTVAVTGVAAMGEAGDVMSAFGISGLAPGAPIEQRVELLERHVSRIQMHDLPEIRKEQREGEQRVVTQLRDVEGRMDQRISVSDAKLTDASVKDLPLEWVGVILLLIGMALSTAAPEIAGWFGSAATCSF